MRFHCIAFLWSTFATGILSSIFTIPEPLFIYYGDDTTIKKVPWQVSLQKNGVHICGGVIISIDWILTVAHCFINGPIDVVHAGSSQSQHPNSVHRIIRDIIHPNYQSGVPSPARNDIALIKVKPPFVIDDTRRPIELYDEGQETQTGVLGTISGWGKTEEGIFPDVLRLVRIPIVSKTKCARSYSGFQEGQICAGNEDGYEDACIRDSGGPLTVRGYLAGLISWGSHPCGKSGFPGVYTEISYFRNWIRDNSGV